MSRFWKFCIAVIIVLLIFLPPISKLHDLQSKNQELEEKIKVYATQNIGLEKEIERLKSDPDYLEAVARDKLKVAKEGEVVYKVESEEKR